MFSFFNTQNITNWKKNEAQFSHDLREKPIIIGNDYIWLSDNKAMIEYNLKKDKIQHITKYTYNIKPSIHCCSEYNGKIYIIDGINGEIILFDPESHSFCKKTNIPKLG